MREQIAPGRFSSQKMAWARGQGRNYMRYSYNARRGQFSRMRIGIVLDAFVPKVCTLVLFIVVGIIFRNILSYSVIFCSKY